MSLLVVGLSHRSAPIHLLERAALDGDRARALAARAVGRGPGTGEPVDGAAGPADGGRPTEALVLATCNRLELYAEVPSFHAGVRQLSAAISEVSGVSLDDLADHLYFHHGDRAVRHLFAVAGGLDSMALGESQVLGQVRVALRRGQDDGTVGRTLQQVVQQALRVGKRVQAETGLGRAGTSLVEAGLEGVEGLLGAPASGLRALVVGAGSMSALAATTLRRRGVGRISIANRSAPRAQHLAAQVGGDWLVLDDDPALVTALALADVVVSCTGATGTVLGADVVAAARDRRRAAGEGDQLVVDLALPHDVDPSVAALPGVHLVGLADLRSRLAGAELDVEDARRIVDEEAAALLAARRAAVVTPTVAALRERARGVVETELSRLRQRAARHGVDLDPRVAAELELTVHRVVEKLLHTPTVRVKELAAGSEGGASYAAALRQLFDLPVDLDGTDSADAGTLLDVGSVLRVDGQGGVGGLGGVGGVGDDLHAARSAS